MSETLHIRSLDIGYRTGAKSVRHVATHINATLQSGELTCLIGPNGIGKSTLLRTLTAFQPPLEGTINLLGRSIDNYSPQELAEVIAVVLTDRVDVRDMNVRQLVSLGRVPYTGFWGSLTSTDRKIVDQAMKMVKIDALAERPISALSDGERQKALIAKALAQEAPIIILDEPTAFLDFPSKVELMQTLLSLCRQSQKTVFLSTHDVEIALQVADRVWLMGADGIHTGSPRELANSGELGSFFASPGLSFDAETFRFKVMSP